jgi:hypothetical protein
MRAILPVRAPSGPSTPAGATASVTRSGGVHERADRLCACAARPGRPSRRGHRRRLPEYNTHGDVASPRWSRLYDDYPDFQLVLWDDATGEILGEANTIPCRFDGDPPGATARRSQRPGGMCFPRGWPCCMWTVSGMSASTTSPTSGSPTTPSRRAGEAEPIRAATAGLERGPQQGSRSRPRSCDTFRRARP